MPSFPIKILLIEDNLGDARLLQETLREVAAAQFELVHVEQLKLGIQRLSQEAFDVILLDLSLPDSQGIDTLCRTQSLAVEAPIVVLTGLNDDLLAIKALQTGAQDYLVKGQVTGDLLVRSMRYAIERRQAENTIRQNEERFRLALDNIPDMFVIYDAERRFQFVNEAGLRWGGKPLEAYLGHRDEDIWPADITDTYLELLQQAIATGVPQSGEYTVTLPGIGTVTLAVRYVPMLDEQGEIYQILGITHDVTKRKAADDKIRQQAALLDVATDAILVRALDSTVLFWNKGAERLYGWKAEEACGQDATHLIYRDTMPELSTIQLELSRHGEWQGELHQITKAGIEIVVESRWTLVQDEQQQTNSILVVNTDITEKKQLETQFLRAQRLESIGTLAGGIAHDLNNILTPILAAAQLLRLKFPDVGERSQRLLETIETNTKRGASLVKQVLSFARGLEGKRTVLQVRHLLAEIQQIIEETFPRTIELSTDLDPQLWVMLGDATQLHQVLMNLCVNARDAMPNGGVLKVVAENLIIDQAYARVNLDARPGAYISITVSDTGTGISPEVLDRMFEPFFTTKEPGKGTGLGLSTVMGIIKGHDGFINVYSELGQGSEFKIYFPAAEVEEAGALPELRAELPMGNGEIILVVDDEAMIRKVTKISLETYAYQVITASDGLEALELCAKHPDKIQVALIDMMMPSMDGVTTIQTLHRSNPHIKIVAVSGLAANQQAAMLASTEVKAFLSKPYTAEKLLKTLYEVLHEADC